MRVAFAVLFKINPGATPPTARLYESGFFIYAPELYDCMFKHCDLFRLDINGNSGKLMETGKKLESGLRLPQSKCVSVLLDDNDEIVSFSGVNLEEDRNSNSYASLVVDFYCSCFCDARMRRIVASKLLLLTSKRYFAKLSQLDSSVRRHWGAPADLSTSIASIILPSFALYDSKGVDIHMPLMKFMWQNSKAKIRECATIAGTCVALQDHIDEYDTKLNSLGATGDEIMSYNGRAGAKWRKTIRGILPTLMLNATEDNPINPLLILGLIADDYKVRRAAQHKNCTCPGWRYAHTHALRAHSTF